MNMFSEIHEISELHGNRNYPFEDQPRATGSWPKILPKEVSRQIRDGHITLVQYVEERQKKPVIELAALNAKPAYSRVIEVAAMRQ